jgi:cytosine/uracil/thiamine/allantoin permease
MPNNQSGSPKSDVDQVALAAEFKKWRSISAIAGVITLVLVIGATFLTDSDKLKEYSFFVAVVPALLVYFLIQAYGVKVAKEKARTGSH